MLTVLIVSGYNSCDVMTGQLRLTQEQEVTDGSLETSPSVDLNRAAMLL